jgi:hypothetical protein
MGAHPSSGPTSDPRTLCFIHIEGTGSARLWPVLQRAYPADACVFIDEQRELPGSETSEQFRHRSVAERGRARLVVGTVPYGAHQWLPSPVEYAALLSDPLERVVALYERTLERSPRDRRPLSLEDFVFRQQRLDVDNGQVRAIAGRRLVGWGSARADLLDEAIRNVERHFAAVLVADEPALSAAALEAATHRRTDGAAEALAERPNHGTTIAPQLEDRIRALNVLDARLYEFARSRLSEPDASSHRHG